VAAPEGGASEILRAVSIRDEELIERLRRNNEALNRGEFDVAIEMAHPEIVFVRPGGLPELRGIDAIRAWMEPDAFESQSIELLSYEVDGNRVLTRQRTTARGAGSGIEMEIDSLSVWTFDDRGMVTRVEAFTKQEEDAALRALHQERN
jgi:limonene-1,2-epoxide hydrolase